MTRTRASRQSTKRAFASVNRGAQLASVSETVIPGGACTAVAVVRAGSAVRGGSTHMAPREGR